MNPKPGAGPPPAAAESVRALSAEARLIDASGKLYASATSTLLVISD